MEKKAQVTIYIIFSVVILIAVGTVFFLDTSKVDAEVKTEVPGEVQYAGQQELRNFMDVCIKEAALNGLEILRLQGGYIEIPSGITTALVKNEKNEEIVTENGIKKIRINPNSKGNAVPYWLDSDNQLSIPSEDYVKNELSLYVQKSVLLCADNFKSFKQQGYVVSTGDVDVNTEFSNEILIDVNYPITFEKGNIRFDEEKFMLRIPINLQKAINLQTDLVIGEFSGSYLESNIKYLLSLYSYAGGDKGAYDLPPLTFTDANSNCKMVTWNLDEAKLSVIENLNNNVKYFQIKGAGEKEPDDESKIAPGVYKGFTSDILVEPYENVMADFRFNSDGLYFDIKPRLGDTIKPSRHTATGIKFLPLFCSVKYQFKYTMKFPMMSRVALTDSPSIDIEGKGLDNDNNFVFEIPMGVFLCGNQNRECTGKPAYASETINVDEIAEKMNISVPIQTMFCDSDMRLSQLMRIRTIDSYNFAPVEDAAVFYRCGSYENDCMIDVSSKEGIVEDRFPLCENGELYALKEGYSENVKALSTYTGGDVKQIDYLIEPLKELDAAVKFVDMNTFMGNYYLSEGFTKNRCTGQSVTPDDSTLAVRSVLNENIIISSNNGPSQVAFVYPENKKVKIASGKYSFSYLAEGDVVVQPSDINGQMVSINKDGSAYIGTYLLGSYNDFSAEFDINILKGANQIIFYVPLELSQRSFSVENIGSNVVQPDGSLYKKGLIDDDCNPATPDKEVEIRVTKEDVERLLRPRLT